MLTEQEIKLLARELMAARILEAQPSKERIVLYTGMYESMKDFLTVEQFGQLFIAIHEYYIAGTEPPKGSPIAFAFSVYKNQFRINDGRSETSADNGSKGGRPPKEKPIEDLGSKNNLTSDLGFENNLTPEIGFEKEPKKPAFMNNEDRRVNKEDEVLNPEPKEVESPTISPFDRLKKFKSIWLSDIQAKYTHVDAFKVGETWEKWLATQSEEKANSTDLKYLCNSFVYFITNANNNAERIAKNRKYSPQEAAAINQEAKAMTKLNQPFD